MKRSSIFLAIALILSGCSQPTTNREQGALTGGLLGGLLGTQFGSGSGKTAAIVGGAAIGAMIGSNIGEKLDEANRHQLSKALATLPAKHSHSWVDHHTGYQYTVTPMKSFHRGATLCRRYRVSVIVNGRVRHASGRACQHSQHDWHIVE